MTHDSTAARAPGYSRTSRVVAALLLGCGWAIVVFLRSPMADWGEWPVALWSVIAMGLCCVGLGIALFLSLVVAGRTRDISAAILPALGAGAIWILIGVPILELVDEAAGGAPPAHGDDFWWSITTVWLFSCLCVALYGPQQFLWRGDSPWRRQLWLVLSAGPPTLLALPLDRLNSIPAMVAAGTLVCLVAWFVEVVRTNLEIGAGLRTGRIGPELPPDAPNYRRDGELDQLVGIALSGGGYRASLFALGAVMYVQDAYVSGHSPRRRVAAVTSVSGGSVTNAAIAHGACLGDDETDSMHRVSRILIGHIGGEGSMFAGAAKIYYFGVLILSVLGIAWFTWSAFDNLTWEVVSRIIAILLIGVLLFAGLHWLGVVAAGMRQGVLSCLAVASSLLAWLGLAGVFVHIVLSQLQWRYAMSWLAAIAVVLASAALIWTLRGTLIQRTFQRLLNDIRRPTSLDTLPETPHHVFCATEVQLDQSAFFARDAIRVKSKVNAPGAFPTALAIRASAAFPGAFPGAFPPVILKGDRVVHASGTAAREKQSGWLLRNLMFVDGGVRDNMGLDWFTRSPALTDELLVVSATANRRLLRPVRTLPGVSEALALRNLSLIPYNSRERNRRRALIPLLFDRSGGGITKRGGALCHIEDSPMDLPMAIAMRGDWSEATSFADDTDAADWQLDQILALEHLRRLSPQTYLDEVSERAAKAIKHLNTVEASLPSPHEMSEADLLGARIGLSRSTRAARLRAWRTDIDTEFDLDAASAWWKRAELSATVPTTLRRIRPETAGNLLIHGYYLAMVNMHVLLDWPLLAGLDHARLDALAGTDASRAAAKRRLQNTLAAQTDQQTHHLRSLYPLLAVGTTELQIREHGRFASRDAVVVVASDQGRMQLLGVWLAPDTENDAIAGERFWRELFDSLAARGLGHVPLLSRQLPAPGLEPNPLLGLDEGLRASFPEATVVPRLRPLFRKSTTPLRIKEAETARVTLAKSEQEAQSLLDRLSERAAETDNRVVEWLTHAREGLMRSVSLPIETRRSIVHADDHLSAAIGGVRDALSVRGPLDTETDALTFVGGHLTRGRSRRHPLPRALRYRIGGVRR